MATIQDVKKVEFLGDELLSAQVNQEVYVSVKSIANALGFTKNQYDTQVQKIKSDLVLSQGARNFSLPTAGGTQETLTVNIQHMPLWLAKINITPSMLRKTPDVAEKLVEYQLKARDVLYDAFFSKPKAMQVLSFEDALIAQLQEQKKIKEVQAAQQQKIQEHEQRLVDTEKHIFSIAENLTKSPERAQLRRALNEYCATHNVTQDMAWSVLTGKILDKFSIDIVRRVDNKRALIQKQRIAEKKKPYAQTTLRAKFTAVDAIFELRLEHEAMKILAGLLAS